MKHVTVADAEERIAELLSDAEGGETVMIMRDGVVVAKLVPPLSDKSIDIDRLRHHQSRFTSRPQPLEKSLQEWKDDDGQ